jgi:hypothetical protein
MTMADVLIPFGREYLALSREHYEEALRRGRELMPPAAPLPETVEREEILDAAGMEERTGIPATWWLEQARRDAIPHIRAGKYVRFQLTAVLQALRSRDGHADSPSANVKKLRSRSGTC